MLRKQRPKLLANVVFKVTGFTRVKLRRTRWKLFLQQINKIVALTFWRHADTDDMYAVKTVEVMENDSTSCTIISRIALEFWYKGSAYWPSYDSPLIMISPGICRKPVRAHLCQQRYCHWLLLICKRLVNESVIVTIPAHTHTHTHTQANLWRGYSSIAEQRSPACWRWVRTNESSNATTLIYRPQGHSISNIQHAILVDCQAYNTHHQWRDRLVSSDL